MATMMNKQCYSCQKEIEDITTASQILGYDKPMFQCEDCMDGSNCFTCECCGDGLATQQVDYMPSRYREWWCTSCAEDHEQVSLNSDDEWIFKEEKYTLNE